MRTVWLDAECLKSYTHTKTRNASLLIDNKLEGSVETVRFILVSSGPETPNQIDESGGGTTRGGEGSLMVHLILDRNM